MIYYVALLESNFSYTFLDSAVDRQRKLIDNIKAQCEDNVALKYLILNGMFSVDKGLSFNEGGGGGGGGCFKKREGGGVSLTFILTNTFQCYLSLSLW